MPSGTYLARLKDKPLPRTEGVLALGDAVYTGSDWSELPGTRLELKTLTELFADKATVLADHAASESRVEALRQDGSLGKFRYLHFASHGEANNFRSFESALILSQDDPKKQEFAPADAPWINGRLTAREVLEYWKLDAELVTLSACQTALGPAGRRRWLARLCPGVSAWPAAAASACRSGKSTTGRRRLLMDRFYRNLLGKRDGLTKPMPKADALAEAKKWLRELTRDEAARRLAGLTEGVARGKNQKASCAVPKLDPKLARPFDHPRILGRIYFDRRSVIERTAGPGTGGTSMDLLAKFLSAGRWADAHDGRAIQLRGTQDSFACSQHRAAGP